MPDQKPESKQRPEAEPLGFAEHTRSLPAEYAHEQGWRMNERERRAVGSQPEDIDGGTDFEYGARDFGDEPVDTSIDPATRSPLQNRAMKQNTTSKASKESNG